MAIGAIFPAGVDALAAAQSSTSASQTGGAAKAGFGEWLSREWESTNTQLQKADGGLRALAVGQTDNLHQVMIDLDKARLSVELMVQVRNRLLDGYDQILRMQI